MNNDLVWGLRNAVERGFTLEQAAKSYIASGYSELEVNEAVQLITSGSGSLMTNPQKTTGPANKNADENKMQLDISKIPRNAPSPVIPKSPLQIGNAPSQIVSEQKQYAPIIPSSPIYTPPVSKEAEPNPERQKKRKAAIIILSILLFILLAGLIGVFYFSDEILNYLSSGI